MLATALFAKAQNEFDALRYSTLDFYGEARFSAMGGSFGALGANLSALSINPGGIGVYKSSDFSFTPVFNYNYSESSKNGNNTPDGKLNFHFGNIGLEGYFNANNGWKNVNMAIGYNRTSNYNSSISINSTTDSSSLNTYVKELNANGGTLGSDVSSKYPFSSNLAYQTYLVNPLVTDSLKYDNVFTNSKNITQNTRYETRGGSGEIYFAFGGNYSDKLYVGASLGIPTIKYVYDRNYTETANVNDTLTQFNSFTVHDYVKTTGAGVNLKLGLIYKVVDWFRIGAAFHTPTLLSLTDEWKTTVTSEDKTGTQLTQSSPVGNFNYLVTTPYRFISSASFIIGNHGVINGDYEIVDYSSARISTDNVSGTSSADFSVENQNIRTNFQLASNIRIGTEWRFDPFKLRAGYRHQGNAINNTFNANTASSTYSVGIGIQQNYYYFDIAYALKRYRVQSPIIADQQDFAAVNLNDHYFSFTLGFRF